MIKVVQNPKRTSFYLVGVTHNSSYFITGRCIAVWGNDIGYLNYLPGMKITFWLRLTHFRWIVRNPTKEEVEKYFVDLL